MSEKESLLRLRRNLALKWCDWTQLPDADLTASKVAEWKAYRQKMRDLPESTGWPDKVKWPVEPK